MEVKQESEIYCEALYKIVENDMSRYHEAGKSFVSNFTGKTEAYHISLIDTLHTMKYMCPKYLKTNKSKRSKEFYGDMIYSKLK